MKEGSFSKHTNLYNIYVISDAIDYFLIFVKQAKFTNYISNNEV